MKLSERQLSINDASVICTFPQSADELFFVSPRLARLNYPPTAEQIWEVAQERHCATVVYDTDTMEIAAYANLYDWNADNRSCWIGNFVVSPHYRGKGAAAYLLEAMAKQARHKLDVRTIKLYCHNTNTRALLFYLKHGFVPCGSKVAEKPDRHKIVSIEMEKLISD